MSDKKGKDLKKAYLEKMGSPGDKMRLFCIGQEIEDEVPLYKYEFANGYVMICQVFK